MEIQVYDEAWLTGGGMTDVDADDVSSVKGARARFRVSCKRKSMRMRWLPSELGFTSDVRASVKLRLSVRMCRS